jgi:cytochrome b
MNTGSGEIKVWDAFVRLGHWSLVVAFTVAYLSAEEAEDLHVAAGWWIVVYLVARIVWGFVGSPHARFSDFVYRPQAVFAYLAGLARGTAPRYLGHNPAGGAMILALLLCLSATVASGLVAQGADEHEGPLAGLFAPPAQPAHGEAAATGREPPAGEKSEEGEQEGKESAYMELHELFANLSLVLIALHLLGVIASSLVHKENLPRAMLTGRKKAP